MKNANKEKVIFIDRDGVINEDPIGDYIKRWEDFRLIHGTLTAFKQLRDAGFTIVIISNQAGIGDGAYPESELNTITKNMCALFKKNGVDIRGVYYCLHGKQEGCDCRKPKPGLFKIVAKDISFAPEDCYFIGDKASDIAAGHAFGLKTVLVLTGHGKMAQGQLKEAGDPEAIVPSIAEAVLHVLKQSGQ
jgi:D-glycero-D-manno-heptose 1,7-bisphosphate phosphatase